MPERSLVCEGQISGENYDANWIDEKDGENLSLYISLVGDSKEVFEAAATISGGSGEDVWFVDFELDLVNPPNPDPDPEPPIDHTQCLADCDQAYNNRMMGCSIAFGGLLQTACKNGGLNTWIGCREQCQQ